MTIRLRSFLPAPRYGAWLAGLVFSLAATSAALAQQQPLPSRMLPMQLDSGYVENAEPDRAVIASFPVHVEGAVWLRMYFSDVELSGSDAAGNASILRLTSHLDGATQELSAEHVAQWRNSSAYFNGDTVQVEIVAYPASGLNRVALDRVDSGLPTPPSESQCGPSDDRVPSNDPRSCRAMPVGCTAWIINDCAHCLLTAGHCCCSSLQVMEFNVPFSQPNGNVVHPPPQDQYAVDPASRQSQYVTIGQDWTYFGCFANSTTGLTPYQAQGQFYTLSAPPPYSPSHVMRITGYGVDSTPNNTYNQIQQTHTGPLAGITGSALYYQVDTQGGNSGSAVQWESGGGVAIGIHTNGGCTTSGGANSGTAVDLLALQNALGNPLGVCRVTASSTSYCTAKVNSLGCTPAISSVGLPTQGGGAGSYSINASNVINQKSGLMFFGFLPAATPLYGGTLCVGGTVVRTPVQNSGGSASGSDCSGTYAFDMGGLIASGSVPAFTCGVTAYAQYWYRDPGFTPPNHVGFTNAIRFVIGP